MLLHRAGNHKIEGAFTYKMEKIRKILPNMSIATLPDTTFRTTEKHSI